MEHLNASSRKLLQSNAMDVIYLLYSGYQYFFKPLRFQLPDKEKDPDWYKSMLKNFTANEAKEKPKLPTVLKKASVYEK